MSKQRKRKTIVAIVILILLGLILYWSFKEPRCDEVIRIGAILPLTGKDAERGLSCKHGMEMELKLSDILDEKYRRGRTWEIVFEDSQSDPDKAIAAMNKLISIDKVVLVIGGMIPATACAIAPIARENQVTLISPTCADPSFTKISRYVFSIFPTEESEGENLGKWLGDAGSDVNRVAVICSDEEAKVACKNAFISAVSDCGVQVTGEEVVVSGTSNFEVVLKHISSGDPQSIFLALNVNDTAMILKAAAKLGITARFLGTSVCCSEEFLDLVGESEIDFVTSAPFFHVKNRIAYISRSAKEFEESYGKKPDMWAAYGVDAVRIASEVILDFVVSHEVIHLMLFETTIRSAATGRTAFNSDGSAKKQMPFLKADFVSRSFVYLQKEGQR